MSRQITNLEEQKDDLINSSLRTVTEMSLQITNLEQQKEDLVKSSVRILLDNVKYNEKSKENNQQWTELHEIASKGYGPFSEIR